MIGALYYYLEIIKFMEIYFLGLKLKANKKISKIIFLFLFTGTAGIFMEKRKIDIMYPACYLLFSIICFYMMVDFERKRHVFFVFWAVGVIFSADTIGYVLIRSVWNVSATQLFAAQNIMSSIFTIIFIGIIFGVVSHTQKIALKDLPILYYVFFLIICIINASVLVLVEKEFMSIHKHFTLVYIMLVFSTLVQMALVFVLASSNKRHQVNEELKEQYLELQTSHYKYLEERNQDTKKFRHDMRAHMYSVKRMIAMKEWEKLDRYIDVIMGKIEHIPGYVSLRNGTVDAILNYYKNQFKNIDCDFRVSGSLPQECFIDAYDLCTIFSNVLSNALDNIESIENKWVELTVRYDHEMILIQERNEFNHEIKREKEIIITSKDDIETHGFGLLNIKDSIRKYNGSINIETEGRVFVIEIMVNNIRTDNKRDIENENSNC